MTAGDEDRGLHEHDWPITPLPLAPAAKAAIAARLGAHDEIRQRGRAMGATDAQIDEALQRIYALPIHDETAAKVEALQQVADAAIANRRYLDGPPTQRLLLVGAIDEETAQRIARELAAVIRPAIEEAARRIAEALRPIARAMGEMITANADAIRKIAELVEAAQPAKPPPAYRQLEDRTGHRRRQAFTAQHARGARR